MGAGGVFAEDAVVLDGFDAGGTGAGYCFLVDDFILEPEVGDAEAEDVVDDGGDELGGAEDVNEVDSLPSFGDSGGLGGVEGGIAGEVEDLGERGVDGEHAIAVFSEVAADVVAGAPGFVAHAEDSDGVRLTEDLVDDGGIVGHGARRS